MTRWNSRIVCPVKDCGGQIEWWVELETDRKPVYYFACSHCDITGLWEQFARQMVRKQWHSQSTPAAESAQHILQTPTRRAA